jgi:hypothetical protein
MIAAPAIAIAPGETLSILGKFIPDRGGTPLGCTPRSVNIVHGPPGYARGFGNLDESAASVSGFHVPVAKAYDKLC